MPLVKGFAAVSPATTAAPVTVAHTEDVGVVRQRRSVRAVRHALDAGRVEDTARFRRSAGAEQPDAVQFTREGLCDGKAQGQGLAAQQRDRKSA